MSLRLALTAEPSALRCFGFGKANPWLGEPPARVDRAEPSALRCFGFSETPCMMVRQVILFVGPLTGAFGFWFILVVFRA